MSYDVSLYYPDVSGDPDEVWWRNHTSNTSAMWRKAGVDIAAMHGRPAAEGVRVLRAAVSRLVTWPDLYRPMEPDNKWGTVETTTAFLSAIADACEQHPDAIVRVSR